MKSFFQTLFSYFRSTFYNVLKPFKKYTSAILKESTALKDSKKSISIIQKKRNDFMSFIINIKHNFLVLSCCSILISMIVISPFTTLYLLLALSLDCLFKGEYKNIFYLWAFYFFSWYLLFTALLFDFEPSIYLGGKYSELVIDHLKLKYVEWPIFETFYLETSMALNTLGDYYGVIIWVPSPFQGVCYLFKRLF